MTLNDAIETYTRESAKATAARKAADAAKKFILACAGNSDKITTDAWIIYIRRAGSFRLDTDALYRDFPDIKETYGKITTSTSLDPHPAEKENVKTA